MRRLLFPLILMSSCFVNSGCTFGPKIEDHYTILKAGLPCRVLDNVSAKTQPLAAEKVDGATLKGVVQQSLGGWVAMPPEHWDVIVRKMDRLRELEAAAKK